MTIFLNGIKTTTPGNSRRHWRSEWAEGKQARMRAKLAIVAQDRPSFPVVVTLIRHSSGTCDKHNLSGCLKHIIDGIADAYGIDDGDDGWDFRFEQVKCKRDQAGVEIRIKSQNKSLQDGGV